MSSSFTLYLAIWSAFLSTWTVFFACWKAYCDNPRIVVTAEALEDLTSDSECFGSINYEVRNRGGKTTTIEEITLVKYRNGLGKLFRLWEHQVNESMASKNTINLPSILKPGEIWTGHSIIAAEQTFESLDKENLVRAGRLFYVVRCSHTHRLISGKVKPESFKLRL